MILPNEMQNPLEIIREIKIQEAFNGITNAVQKLETGAFDCRDKVLDIAQNFISDN